MRILRWSTLCPGLEQISFEMPWYPVTLKFAGYQYEKTPWNGFILKKAQGYTAGKRQ